MRKILMMASVMMLGASGAWALGTTAGTDISNSATLSYSAGGVSQPDVPTQQPDTFKVDKKVDMVLTTTDTDQQPVTPGQTDRITNYTFKNEGNAAQKFTFTATNLTTADAHNGEADYNTKVDNQETDGALTIEYSTDGGNTWQAYNAAITVAEDATVDFRVKANIKTAANGAANGDIMNVELVATAVKDDGTTAETESASDNNDPNVVDVVLADGTDVQNGSTAGSLGDVTNGKGDTAKDGKEAARSGYIIQTPVLALDKTSCVISDPVNNTTNPKRIPGAVIRYMLDVKNTGSADASGITITDDLNTNLDYSTVSAPNDNTFSNVNSCDCANPQGGTISTTHNTGADPQVKFEGIAVDKPIAPATENHSCVYFEVEVK